MDPSKHYKVFKIGLRILLKNLFQYFKQKYDSLITTNDYMTTCCLFMTVVTEAYAYIRGKFGILMNEGNNVVLLLYMHVL